jgi:hypothetical protein
LAGGRSGGGFKGPDCAERAAGAPGIRIRSGRARCKLIIAAASVACGTLHALEQVGAEVALVAVALGDERRRRE